MCGKGESAEIKAGLAEMSAALLCGDKVLTVHSSVGSVAHISLWILGSFFSLGADSEPSERSDLISLKFPFFSLLQLSEMPSAFPAGLLSLFDQSPFCIVIIHPLVPQFLCLLSPALISSPPLSLSPLVPPPLLS